MTLRLRLVIALVALSTIGLAVFGVATYGLYARTQYDRLDSQLKASAPILEFQLRDDAGIDAGPRPGGDDGGGGGRGPRPPTIAPAGTYAQLRTEDGTIIARHLPGSGTTSVPKLPTELENVTTNGRYFTTGSATGSGTWRVYVKAGNNGDVVVLATPVTEVTNALNRLVLIEGISAALLLGALGVGSAFILRHGLRPLEQMATTARSISAGDLSQRVDEDEKSEVGQLGVAINTMLGDLEEAFQEREATEHRLRQFLADASHELRTPLTSIQGFAELFRLDASHEHVDLGVILRRIEQESARMRTLVDDLLLLARVDQVREVEREQVDLAVLAADACSDAVAMAPDRQVTLDAPEPVIVLGDAHHLRQAIANMVTNAVKHTPEGTPLEVTAGLDNGAAIVRVRDHGTGLDDEALAHVFDRFWQADKARVGTGAGLGLSIVAAIAAEHGGQASAANAEDGGAVFTLRLPLTQSERLPAPS